MQYRKITSPQRIRLADSLVLEGDSLDVLRLLPSNSVQCAITSPPYWGLRDYNINGQIGLEPTLQEFINHLVAVFNELKRVLREDGTLWLNIGDGYTSGNRGYRAADKKNPARAMTIRPDTPEGLKPKDLQGIPWRLAFALQDDGWYLRSDIIWNKPNAMPESVKDRPTKSHEYLFMLTKSEQYYYNYEASKEIGLNGEYRNRRTVWNINTQSFQEAHFATFPQKLVEPCVFISSKPGDFILDPFFGSGTVGVVCVQNRRHYVGIELNPEYIEIAAGRLTALGTREANIMKVAV
jgi:site-specific DNA-methyltransferase (adenine-specific)